MLIRDMSNEQLKEYHDRYLRRVWKVNEEKGRNNTEYKEVYHRWFLLRSAGEKRNMWLFIPSPEELRSIDEGR